MAGEAEIDAICCFCSGSLRITDSVEITLTSKAMGEESQHMVAHRKCFRRAIDPGFPLHPYLTEE